MQHIFSWKDAGVVDRGGLENRYTLWVSRVRIPVFPQKQASKPLKFKSLLVFISIPYMV